LEESRTKQGEETAPIPPGGAPSGLDLTNVRDQGLARQAIKNWPKRWKGLTEEFKDRCAKQLQIAIDEADSLAMAGPEGIAEAAKIRLSAVKTAAMMEAQNQKDDHAEAGVAATNVTVNNNTIIAIPPPSRARIDAE